MIPAIITGVLEVIRQVAPDPKAAAEQQHKVLELAAQGQLASLEAATKTIVAEASSEHKITSTWRPITMLTFVAIIANNYIVYPYLSLFWPEAPMLALPDDLWDLLKIGLGGYVVGRSGEKIAKVLKDGND